MRRLPPPSRSAGAARRPSDDDPPRAALAAPRRQGAVALPRAAGTLVWRDVAVRYKQTSIGVAWAILQPFLTMVVFTFVFGRLRQLPVERRAVPDLRVLGAPAVDVLRVVAVGLAARASSPTAGSSRRSTSRACSCRSPASPCRIVDFLLAFVVLVGMMVWYQVWPGCGHHARAALSR